VAATNPCANVSLPAGAIEVFVAGLRRTDGSIDPEIVVHQLHADEPLKSAATARQPARALIDAADEIDRWATT
jgi:hypothetical protein